MKIYKNISEPTKAEKRVIEKLFNIGMNPKQIKQVLNFNK